VGSSVAANLRRGCWPARRRCCPFCDGGYLDWARHPYELMGGIGQIECVRLGLRLFFAAEDAEDAEGTSTAEAFVKPRR